MSEKFHNKRCATAHMGLWSMNEMRFNQLKSLILGGKIVLQAQDEEDIFEDDREETLNDGTMLTRGGVLIIPLEGTLMKVESSFGGTSTVRVRRQLQIAARDPVVKAVLLKVDSPGGTVSGTDELATEIANFPKPIRAHADGLMASAAFWIGAQADTVSASRTSEVGSLGTFLVVHDFSEAFEKEGIKTHVVSTGPFKGAGIQGSEITDLQLEDFQKSVLNMNEFFIQAVIDGRKMQRSHVEQLFDGRVHISSKAMELGMIDQIISFEEAVSNFEVAIAPDETDAELLRTRLKLARLRNN